MTAAFQFHRCSVCLCYYKLRKDGTLRKHTREDYSASPSSRRLGLRIPCDGSLKPPREGSK